MLNKFICLFTAFTLVTAPVFSKANPAITGKIIEKESGNPERYVYEILPAGKKHYKKLLKQYFDSNFIHFDVDIVLMFFDFLSEEQKEQFLEERTSIIKDKIDSIKEKIERNAGDEKSYRHILTYLEHHLKAELAWLKTLKS